MGDFVKNVLAPFSAVAAALLAAWVNYSVSEVKSGSRRFRRSSSSRSWRSTR
jgi:hypothetical protein